MEPSYPNDAATGPLAVPGVVPRPECGSGAAAVALEVDGEMFELRPDEHDGTSYAWLTGPNTGYGFASSPTPN